MPNWRKCCCIDVSTAEHEADAEMYIECVSMNPHRGKIVLVVGEIGRWKSFDAGYGPVGGALAV